MSAHGKPVEVADRVWDVGDYLVNWYAIEDGGRLTLVDAGSPKDAEVLDARLAAIGRTVDDVEAVVLTHAHADHFGVAEHVRTAAAARVWLHQADTREGGRMRSTKRERGVAPYVLRATALRNLLFLVRRGLLKPVPVRELSAFSDGDVLDVPGKPRVVHLPGHTKGSCGIFLEDRGALCTGDSLITTGILSPRTGPQIAPRAFNEDSRQALASLDRIAALKARVILPGHGDPWTEGADAAVRRARSVGVW